MKRFITVLLFSTIALQAQAYIGAVSSATAEAGRASVEPTDAAFVNPATLPFLRGYYFTTGYSAAQSAASAHEQDFAVSLIDNLPDTIVPTALGYTQSKTDFSSEEATSRDIHLSFANYATQHLSAGVGLRYREDQVARQHLTQTNMSLSGLYSVNADLGFAAILDNILGSDGGAPEDVRLVPTTAFGMNYIYKKVIRTRFDLVSSSTNSWDRPSIEAGLEMYMNKWLILRMGVQRNNEENANAYAAGLGFVGPKFGIHYAYFMSPEQESLTRHALDLAVPIW